MNPYGFLAMGLGLILVIAAWKNTQGVLWNSL